MNIDIRKYIINNFKSDTKEEIEEAINDSINSKEEEILPGLGVLFELVWNSELRQEISDTIYKKIK